MSYSKTLAGSNLHFVDIHIDSKAKANKGINELQFSENVLQKNIYTAGLSIKIISVYIHKFYGIYSYFQFFFFTFKLCLYKHLCFTVRKIGILCIKNDLLLQYFASKIYIVNLHIQKPLYERTPSQINK